MSIFQGIKDWFSSIEKFREARRNSNRLSIKDMMSMSDEELGKEFRKHGEWKASKKGEKSILAVSLLIGFSSIGGVISGIITLGLLINSLFNPSLYLITSLFFAVTAIIGYLCYFACSGSLMFSILKRRNKYDEFDGLGFDSNLRYEILTNFIHSVNTKLDTKTHSLSEYNFKMTEAINHYHGYSMGGDDVIDYPSFNEYRYQYTDTDIGRMLKLIISVIYLEQNTELNETTFSELDRKFNLNHELDEFNKEIERKNKELDEAARKQYEAERVLENRKRQKETSSAISDLVSFKKESENLENNPEYARINDISRRLEKSRSTLQSKVSSKNED